MATDINEHLRNGLVPQGYQKKSFDPITQQSYVESDSGLGRAAQVIQRILVQRQQVMKDRREKLEKQFDMYKVLRDAGYDPKSAHEAVQKNQMPAAPGGESLEEQEKKATIEEKQAKADYYRKGASKRTVIDQMTPNQLQSRLKFLLENPSEDEASDQQEISAITRKIREMTLGKTQAGQEAPAQRTEKPVKSEKSGPRVLMEKPDGTKVRVAAADVNKALKKGYKVADGNS